MIAEKIQEELKNAMKSKDAFRLSALRMAQAAIKMRALEKRAALVKAGGVAEDVLLSDDESIAVLRGETKRRKDAAGEFQKGNRQELAKKEMEEAAILQEFLPAEASDEDVMKAVKVAIQEVGKDPKGFGRVMGLAMKSLANTSSGDRVSLEVRKQLGA